jgi:hypothetical protein
MLNLYINGHVLLQILNKEALHWYILNDSKKQKQKTKQFGD